MGHQATFALLVALILAVAIAVQVHVWQECRADHSWLYCLNLVSR